jgi:hypothetical protein
MLLGLGGIAMSPSHEASGDAFAVHSSAITNRYLVLAGVGCIAAQITNHTQCWSLSSGGAVGASVPGPSEMMVFDSLSGSTRAKLNGNMNVYGFRFLTGSNSMYLDFQTWQLTVGAGGWQQSAGAADLQSGTLILNGDFNNIGSYVFDGGTSAAGWVYIASNMNISTQDDSLHFFDRLIVNAGVTATLLTDIRMDEWERHLTVNGVFNAGSHNVRFQWLTVGPAGSLIMSGSTVSSPMSFKGDSGLILLSNWAAYQPSISIKWTFDPSPSSMAITMTFNGLSPRTPYGLKRDGVQIDRANSDAGGMVTFVETGGWSPHVMEISPSGDASSSPPPVVQQPTNYFGTFNLFGLQFHDGLVIVPGLITVLILFLVEWIWRIGLKTRAVLAGLEIAAIIGIALVLGPGLVEFATVAFAFAAINLLGGAATRVGMRRGLWLGVIGAAAFLAIAYVGVGNLLFR